MATQKKPDSGFRREKSVLRVSRKFIAFAIIVSLVTPLALLYLSVMQHLLRINLLYSS
jgi:hypothetical protein